MFQEYSEKLLYNNIANEYIGYDNHSVMSLIKKGLVPVSQKQIAANYMVIKKIYGYSVVHSQITNSELSLLKFYNMRPLEETSSQTILGELELLRDWANGEDDIKARQADNIFEIRVKELRFLQSNNSAAKLSEFYDGYKTLEKYLEYISK